MSEKRFGQAFTFKKHKGFKGGPKKKAAVLKKSQVVDSEIHLIQKRINDGIDASKIETFGDFPLSKNTFDGLKKAKYTVPTEIQKQSIALALQGKDVLGAAKTGSGKTLAFLIPVLETLYKAKTSPTFGMAALIITPTRELAFQIFEVLNKIRISHDFSANLVIGGKYMWREERLMCNTNIVISTPGRLLHHLDQTRQFNADELKILVLDEADRIMDSKFAKDMDHIIGHLPSERQTLMFSATQTKSVKALARLSLKNPSNVSVDEHAENVTPDALEQSYIVCELHDKLAMIHSFLKNHTHTKIVVFLQTCKQVRYIHAVMKRELPGMPMLALHGHLKQLRRIDIYREFCRKEYVVMFATDIACRGLDFPAVKWVVQLDCPVDVDTYIHRAGRTARYQQNGQALLVLMPSEEEHMVAALHRRKIPIKKIRVNMKMMRDITGSTAAACSSCQETKNMAERAFKTYVFSIHVMKNKNIFDVLKLDLDAFAKSLGLFITPRLKYLEGNKKKIKQKAEKKDSSDSSDSDDSDDGDDSDDSGNDNSLFTVKPTTLDTLEVEKEQDEEELNMETNKKKTVTKASMAKKLLKKGIIVNSKIKFDEDGSPVLDSYKRRRDMDDEDEDDEGGINVQLAAKRLRLEDEVDKKLERERVKQKHREERIKKKERQRAENQQRRAVDSDEGEEAVLSGGDDEDDPFKYIPDPDKLAARNEDGSSEMEADDNENSDDDEEDSDESDGDRDEDEGDESSEDDNDDDDDYDKADQGQRKSLEDAAFSFLKKSKMK